MNELLLWISGTVIAIVALRRAYNRLLLSRAKHPSLQGHARLGKRLARLLPSYEYDEKRFFDSDGAPHAVVSQRKAGFDRLADVLESRAAKTIGASAALESGISDVQFTKRYRVPFQYTRYVAQRLRVGSLLQSSSGVTVTNLDGHVDYELTGSYGVNLFGNDFYKSCIDAGIDLVRSLGPQLGAYHPVILDNVRWLKEISGMDEVSFHMSGTEAVMQAVRLARFHTSRSHVVRFCGAYHGWWDDVQPGVRNPATVRTTYTLKDMDDATLRVLATRRDIACVLVNPLQALHPNSVAPADGTLVDSSRRATFDREAYAEWLKTLRAVCTQRSIVLIFDEIFVGFRIARGGAQEYFNVRADLVTYGKTVGGGLPIGVVCGKARYMKRFREDRPSDVCFARGTFNSHPYVMGAMHEFLRRLNEPELRRAYDGLGETWDARARGLNQRLEAEDLPVRVVNLISIWTVCYSRPSRYNWMFQYYLRAEGLALSWIGTGRLIFSHNYADADVAAVCDRLVAAARAMRDDGWWWHSPALTNRAITRQILRETIAELVRQPFRRSRQATVSSRTIGSNNSPRTT
jgi:glutamate-1-semialdehyde 2,1-aminomutase